MGLDRALQVADDPCRVLLSSTGLLARTANGEPFGESDGKRVKHDVIVSAVPATARGEVRETGLPGREPNLVGIKRGEVGGDVGADEQTEPAEHELRVVRQVGQRHLERAAHLQVARGERGQAAFLDLLHEVAERPARATGEPVARDPQCQRQHPALVGGVLHLVADGGFAHQHGNQEHADCKAAGQRIR